MQFREKAYATLVLCLAFAGSLPLIGCQTRTDPATAQEAPAVSVEAPTPVPSADPAEISALLDDAEAAMQRGQLTYPAQGSALIYFDTVLTIEPGNAEAQRGLERILEHYLELAEAAARNDHLGRASAMLDRARVLDPDHPAVASTALKLNLLTHANRDRLALDGTQLSNRSADLRQPLQSLGSQARGENCRASIRARNDAEGRWIYQQMSLGPGDARIRAEIRIGSPPLVELICFQGG